MPIQLNCDIDMAGLRSGIEAAQRYSKRTLPQAVNTALYSVALAARDDTPFITLERIDQDFATKVTVATFKSGKQKSAKRYQNLTRSGKAMLRMETASGENMVPRAAAIVAARASQAAKYNSLTANRWALSKNPFAGVSRAAGQAAMAALVSRMLGARHSSSKYLLAGWLPAISILFPFVQHKFLKADSRPAAKGKIDFDLGTAKAATEADPTAMIENAVGMEGRTGPKANQALILHVTTVLQRACDNEGVKNLQYALDHAEAEMSKEVEKHWA